MAVPLTMTVVDAPSVSAVFRPEVFRYLLGYLVVLANRNETSVSVISDSRFLHLSFGRKPPCRICLIASSAVQGYVKSMCITVLGYVPERVCSIRTYNVYIHLLGGFLPL